MVYEGYAQVHMQLHHLVKVSLIYGMHIAYARVEHDKHLSSQLNGSRKPCQQRQVV